MQVRRAVGLSSLALVVAACAFARLTLPGPILGLEDKTVTRSAILEGMATRGWVVEQEEKRRILARGQVRGYVAKVWIDYSERQVAFRYGGSEGLGCDREPDSCTRIHGKYNQWARNLALAISREMTKRRALEPAPGAA